MHPVISLCLLVVTGDLVAAVAEPDVLIFNSDRSGNHELYRMALDGSGATPLTADTTYDSWWGRPSPDGRHILFHRTPKGIHDTDYGQVSIWRIGSDGTGLVRLRAVGTDGWTLQGHVEWSPDGQHICTIGTAGGWMQIFVMDANGLFPRQVTTTGSNKIDCSWSPDGLDLLLISKPSAAGAVTTQEIYRVPAAGGALTRLTNDGIEDYDPYYSPDGTRIAWLSQTAPDLHGPGLGAWNIRVMDATGANVALVTNDLNINSKPEWSRDGGTIYFHRFVYGAVGAKWDIYRTPASGGAITPVSPGAPGNNEFPAHLHHAPVVTVTAPVPGAVAGTVIVTAEAVSTAAITSVRFQVDGVDLASDASAPYSCSWDASSASPGTHVLRAIATDVVAGTATSSPVSVTVAGPGGSGGSAGDDEGDGGCGLGGGASAMILLVMLGLRRQTRWSAVRPDGIRGDTASG
jgi:hypothetical protein